MQTLRLSLVGTVTLALLGVPAGAVTGQADPGAPAWATLLTVENGRVEGGHYDYEPGVGLAKKIRALPLAMDKTYSDGRLDGTQHWLYSEDCFESGMCVGWGTMRIEGPDGTTWSGWWHEIDDDETDGEDNTSFHVVLDGTGPYEGLTAILFSLGVWEQFPDAEYALIYPGDPPPGPEELLPAG